MRSVRVLRRIIVSIVGTLAIVLLVRGRVLLGGLLLALAVARAAMLVRIGRRRVLLRERFRRVSSEGVSRRQSG